MIHFCRWWTKEHQIARSAQILPILVLLSITVQLHRFCLGNNFAQKAQDFTMKSESDRSRDADVGLRFAKRGKWHPLVLRGWKGKATARVATWTKRNPHCLVGSTLKTNLQVGHAQSETESKRLKQRAKEFYFCIKRKPVTERNPDSVSQFLTNKLLELRLLWPGLNCANVLRMNPSFRWTCWH